MVKQLKKVLFVLPSMKTGGAERVVSLLLKQLVNDYECHLCLIHDSKDFFEIPKNVKLYKLNREKVLYAYFPIIKLVRQLKADIVFSSLAHLNMMLLMARPFFPKQTKVYIREGSVVTENIKAEPHPHLMNFFYHWLYPRADKIICQSKFMVRELHENFKIAEEKCICIYNPVQFDTSFNTENPFTKPESYPKLLSVGRLDPVKQYHLILNEIPSLIKRFPNLSYTLIGEGSEQLHLKKLCSDIGVEKYVHFLPQQKDCRAYYQYCDLFLVCSRYEGLPNVLLEAIAARSSIMVLKHPGGAKEVLEQIGLSQVFKNELIFEEPFKKIPEENYQKAKELLSLDTIIKDYKKLFNDEK